MPSSKHPPKFPGGNRAWCCSPSLAPGKPSSSPSSALTQVPGARGRRFRPISHLLAGQKSSFLGAEGKGLNSQEGGAGWNWEPGFYIKWFQRQMWDLMAPSGQGIPWGVLREFFGNFEQLKVQLSHCRGWCDPAQSFGAAPGQPVQQQGISVGWWQCWAVGDSP